MKKNGFTLIELLGVLVILGLIAAISIAVYSSTINEAKNNLSDVQKKNLEEAARTYVAINTMEFNRRFAEVDCGNVNSRYCVSIGVDVLSHEGLIDSIVYDPKNSGTTLNGYVEVNYDCENNQYKYTYSSNTTCKYSYRMLTVDGESSVDVCERGGSNDC